MAYVSIPPTVARARDENKQQRACLHKWQCDLEKYPKLCPQLRGPISILQEMLKELQQHLQSQEILIAQRIHLQTLLAYPDLANASHKIPNPTELPLELRLPAIENKTLLLKTRPVIRPKTRAVFSPPRPNLDGASTLSNNDIPFTPRRYPGKLPAIDYKTQRNSSDNAIINAPVTRLSKGLKRQRTRPLAQTPTSWAPIPENLRAYPSVFEQLIKTKEPSLTSQEWCNRFSPIFIDYSMDFQAMERVEPPTPNMPTLDHLQTREEEMPEEPMIAQNVQEHPNEVSKLTMDMLRDLIPVPVLDPTLITETPTTYAAAVRVDPQGFTKVRLEVHIGRFPKDTTRTDRILSLFEVARLYDKHVCLCPSGPEPNPVLYTPYDIKRSRIYRYFQDKQGAQKGKYANSLYGYIVFGVTGDLDDFVMAMKEWATSNRHELTRHGVPSTSVIAGFIVHSSLTLNRDDMVNAIRNTQEWQDAGCPEFSVKISPLWSSGGAEAKVPAICCECERTKVSDFEKMCEALFFGENLSLPSAIRAAYFFPSRKFSANDPSRLAYIGGQRDFLTTERTITCSGLLNIYQEVRLKRDPKYSSTIEDVILLLPGTTGPLFRSMDRTIEDKVFLKIDSNNLGAWAVQKDHLGDHLRALVHPDDHTKVFRLESQELIFSEPWLKFKDGQLTKNVMQLPCKDSLAYVNRYKAKFTSPDAQLPPLIKKRIHSNVSSDAASTATTASTTSSSTLTALRPLSQSPVIDLTRTSTSTDSVASPSHKVHVVEQRAFQDHASPLSSTAESQGSALEPRVTSPQTARMRQLESKVEAHDKKLTDIQTSVSALDAKIVHQGEKSSFQFTRFEEMLSHIHGTIVQSMQQVTTTSEPPAEPITDSMQSENEAGYEDGAYNPIQHSADWNEEWRRYQLSRSRVDMQRAECAERLCKEAESKGECYDYYAVACERIPSPPPVNFPDDITYTDDL